MIGLLVLLVVVPASWAEGPINEMCPVFTDEPVQPGLVESYGDVEIGFCCELCWSKFTQNPEPYLANLPADAAAAVRAELGQGGVSDSEAGTEKEAGPGREIGEAEPQAGELLRTLSSTPEVVALVALLLVAVLLGRRESATAKRLAVGLVVLGLLGAAGVSWWRAERARAELAKVERELQLQRWKELIHNNTYYDFGDPPRPVRPPVEPALQATYYRGNDERSDELFNGGHYRTSTFELSVVDGDGAVIDHGDDVSGRELWLRYEVVRGANTPDFFWGDDIMGPIFLTANGDPFLGYRSPLTDPRGLEVVEEMQRWEARYPLGEVVGRGEEHFDEVVYVADPWWEKGEMIGATFHYGIEVVLTVRNGRVADDAEVFMGALFRPRKSPYSRVPPEEWLSHEPIPELPAPQGDDPETLGIVDYLDGSE